MNVFLPAFQSLVGGGIERSHQQIREISFRASAAKRAGWRSSPGADHSSKVSRQQERPGAGGAGKGLGKEKAPEIHQENQGLIVWIWWSRGDLNPIFRVVLFGLCWTITEKSTTCKQAKLPSLAIADQ
ncbi:TPA: hypothetical protein ONA18_005426 [Pseudomonas aeruginosa]|nr:hypothetical protein [Pseudomonas aeruginosa]